jgi:hypothetical protein
MGFSFEPEIYFKALPAIGARCEVKQLLTWQPES